MTIETDLLGLAEYASLPAEDGSHVTELVRGVVVREPRPGARHGSVQARLVVMLGTWARERGAVVTVESGYIISEEPATVRGPDVAVVLRPRPSEGEPGGWIRGAPDLVVEVVSPSDVSASIHEKTLQYLEAGARLVWVVDPGTRSVTVYRPDGSANVLRGDSVLTGEDVLAGLEAPLAEIFG